MIGTDHVITLLATLLVAAIGSFMGTIVASYILVHFLQNWALNFYALMNKKEKENAS